MKKIATLILALTLCAISFAADFAVFDENSVARILYSDTDAKVISIAARDLAADIELVSGKKTEVIATEKSVTPRSIIIGTLASSPLIDAFVASGKLDVSAFRDQWKTFLITTVGDSFVIASLEIADCRGAVNLRSTYCCSLTIVIFS